MMTAGARISLALCLASCFAPAAEGSWLAGGRGQVTPVEKVVTLLENLIAEVEEDGGKESSGYNEFACFCKSKSTELSEEILSTQDSINQLSAEIEMKTALKAESEDKLVEEKAKLEKLKADLEALEAENAKAKAAYEATDADLVKAIGSCMAAIEALEKSKPAAAGSAAAAAAGLVTVKANIQKSLALADAMKIIDDGPKWQEVSALLQGSNKVNPDDPDYKFHSKKIMEVISDLQTKFEEQKKEADLEEAARVKTYEETRDALTKEIELTESSIESLEAEIAQLTEDIATARHSLVEAEATLKDAKLYLTDLTESCEKRAKDWDQRTAVRFDELANLKKALALLTDVVMEKSEVNKRALLIQNSGRNGSKAVNNSAKAVNNSAPPSFLQEAARLVTIHRLNSSSESQDREVRKSKALDLLRMEGARLGSAALSALASRATADPFLKVKELIQKLIERLVHEATEEATKKGFCDTELAKNEKDREYRMQDVMKLNTELGVLEAKRDFLENEITELKAALDVLYEDLKKATETRETEKAANLATIATAKEGAVALKEAMLILQTFYGEAAKTTENLGKYAQVQTKSKAKYSPMEEDTAGAGFEGNYGGKQDAMKAIIGILDVIKSDFARTMRVTTEAEAKAHADFVIYERNTKADIASKETKVELDTNDLETTKATIEQKMMDMQTNMDLVDEACKALEALKPMCIDSGMSYEERVAKREEEIEQLKKAVCILDESGVEPGC